MVNIFQYMVTVHQYMVNISLDIHIGTPINGEIRSGHIKSHPVHSNRLPEHVKSIPGQVYIPQYMVNDPGQRKRLYGHGNIYPGHGKYIL
jgi:hypothetical protein